MPACFTWVLYARMQNCLQCCWDGGYYNPADGRIYMALRCGTRAASFDTVTKTWESFGETFPQTEALTGDKWAISSVSSIDNCMYQFPWHLSKFYRILKTDPANRTTQEVGEDVRPLAGGVKELCWMAAVANAEGIIFGVPCNANSIIRFDPRTNELSTFGQLEDTGEWKYMQGILDPSGRYIFCIPMMTARVLCVDTQENSIELIGPDFGRGADGNFMSQGKWLGGALGGDNYIYALPVNSRRLLRIDPASRTVSLFGPDLHRVDSHETIPWGGLTTGLDGCLYGTPMAADHVLRIDPFSSTVCAIGEPMPPDQRIKMALGVRDKDGAIWMLPHNAPARMLRVGPRPPQTPLLATLLQPEHHIVLREGLQDLRCYGPALAVALWREAVRTGGDNALVCRLLEVAATVLPTVILASIKKDNGSTACMLLRTILAMFSSEVGASGPLCYGAGR